MDPYEEYVKENDAEARKAREDEQRKRREAEEAGKQRGAWFSNPANRPGQDADADDGEVGKHLAKALAATGKAPAVAPAVAPAAGSTGGAATSAGPADVHESDATDEELYAQQKRRRLAGRADMRDFSAW